MVDRHMERLKSEEYERRTQEIMQEKERQARMQRMVTMVQACILGGMALCLGVAAITLIAMVHLPPAPLAPVLSTALILFVALLVGLGMTGMARGVLERF